jgi:hypothetical protein
MAITATLGGSNDTRVSKIYIPAQNIGLAQLPDVDATTKNALGPVIWDNTASKYKTSGQMSISSTEIDLTATDIDINGDVDISGDLDVGGDLTVTGVSTLNGGTLTLGNADTDNVVFSADINSNIIPNTDNTYDLGTSTKEWRNLYIDGTAHIDTLDIDNNATINGTLTMKSHVDLQDNDKIKVGTGDDMQIYHDGNNSYITNDVGALKIATEDSGIAVTIGHATSEVTVADNLTVTGTITGDVIGDTTGTASLATSITASANNSTNETVYPTFVDGATGTQGIETDTGLTYNPSTGVLTTTSYAGDGSNLTGVVSTLEALTDTTITSITTNDMLSYSGSAWVNAPITSAPGNFTVGGTLTVNGTTTTVNSTVTTIDDPIMTLGGDTAPASDDNKDRGIEFRYHTGSAAAIGFFGYDDSTSEFTGYTAATNSSEVFSGTRINANFGNIAGTLTTAAQTAITSVGTLSAVTVSGATTLNGAVTLGDATGDDIVVTGRVASHVVPKTNDTYDLGTSALRYRELFLSGSTINLGGATISSDGTGTLSIAAAGAVLPAGSKVGTDTITVAGDDGQIKRTVPLFTQAGGLVTAAVNFTMKASGVSELLFTDFTLSTGSNIITQERTFFSF